VLPYLRNHDDFHSPHLADVEVTQGLRRIVRTGEVSPDRAAEAIADLADLDLHRHYDGAMVRHTRDATAIDIPRKSASAATYRE
jgi:predicted nucleic acid-binding protein